ncbi:UPF0669 protein v1g209471-like [Saccostrea echinata]|uniref:UPF0669 protein v1g209471-like n=1 Tax=Saccostrea echinata TaxID=191078 RepID=UPI002A802702|nr:UPF0669 protein v1g209471-like [Saccostrea echinata]
MEAWVHYGFNILLHILIVSLVLLKCYGEEFLQSVTEEVLAGNYTIYRIKSRGRLRLELVSHEGDADIYVSDSESRPSYENYDLKSITCGVDLIEVSSKMKRPVAVGVFGHPFYRTSKYTLSVYKLPDVEVDYATLDALYNSYTEDTSENEQDSQKSNDEHTSTEDQPDEDSTLWTIVITILKILFDILL